MSRMHLKIIISLLVLLTVSSGFKAIQINVDQKLELKEYEALIHAQMESALDLEVKLSESLIQIEALKSEMSRQKTEMDVTLLELNEAHTLLKIGRASCRVRV